MSMRALGTVAVLLFAVTAIAQTAEMYSSPGPFAVKHVDGAIHDQQRSKDIPMRIYWPDAKGTYPVIVFSHGASASQENYGRWAEHWAAHGYVVVLPTHDDSIALRRSRGDEYTVRDALRDAMANPQAWRERPRDISSVIDALDRIEAQTCNHHDGHENGASPCARLDRHRIGVGGHSFGGYTAEEIGGAVGGGGNLRDKRVRAVILMSPQGEGQMGFTRDSFKTLTVPAMVMTGSRDRGGLRQDAAWRKQPFELSPPGDKYLLWIEGANHFTFSPPNPERAVGRSRPFRRNDPEPMYDAIAAASTAFWDAYLKDDKQARRWLQADELQSASQGQITLQHR